MPIQLREIFMHCQKTSSHDTHKAQNTWDRKGATQELLKEHLFSSGYAATFNFYYKPSLPPNPPFTGIQRYFNQTAPLWSLMWWKQLNFYLAGLLACVISASTSVTRGTDFCHLGVHANEFMFGRQRHSRAQSWGLGLQHWQVSYTDLLKS